MEAHLHSQKEYKRKIRSLEEKLEKSSKKNKESSKELKYLRKRLKEVTASRDGWKIKNHSKRLTIKSLQKKVNRQQSVKRHLYPLWLIVLSVRLRVVAGCSYRGTIRVLTMLRMCYLLNLPKIPCANTVENWVSKMGYYCMENTCEMLPNKDVCLIIDESIKQGNERILLLLVTPWQKEKEDPLGYTDTKMCYLGGSSSWTGEKIKAVVEKTAREGGFNIKGVLSDEDSKLLKAARLMELPHLPDIGHAVASCLRKTFEKDTEYIELIKLITSCQAKAVNQELSYLRPPKQRVKARFMNQKRFVEWGLNLLDSFGKLNEKESTFFAGLSIHRPMLEILRECINMGEKVAKVLKAGLSKATVKQVEQILNDYKGTQDLTKQFIGLLRSYLTRYSSFLKVRDGVFNISSDVIESLFGKHKNMGPSDTLVGVTQLDLELAVYCLADKNIPRFAKAGLESVFTSEIAAWRDNHSSGNQAVKRKKLLKK